MAGGGNIIDTESEPGAYADALRFPPYIHDGDGTFFNDAYFLTRVTPDFPHARVTLGGGKSSAHLLQNARGGLANRDALAAPLLNVPFHTGSTSAEEAQDCADQ